MDVHNAPTPTDPSSPDWWPWRSSGRAFVDGPGEDDHADQPDRARRPEWQRRSHLPEQTTDEGGRCDGETPDQIVEPDGSRSKSRFREIDDEGLARRLPELTQTADDEGDHETREASGQNDGDREERERDERGRHEWLPTDAIGQLSGGEVA